ncbi:MAG: hypothetical protein ABF303_02025 [Desulfobacterales bacterium]|jgi:hypothetical protein
MSSVNQSQVTFVHTEDRKTGVVQSIEALQNNPAEIDLIAANEQSRNFRDKVDGILNQG